METAFWDSSSAVPLCVQQPASPVVLRLSALYRMTVWWAAPVEMRSAFARLVRMGQLTKAEQEAAHAKLAVLRDTWKAIQPSEQPREEAEAFVGRFPLKAADALQLAAAMAWCRGRPGGRVFISGDSQLLEAARQLGFQAIET